MKKDLADLLRQIQNLNQKKWLTQEQKEEYSFYNGLLEVICQVFVPNNIGSIVEINLYSCSFARGVQLASELGLVLLKGSSGTTYISWPDKPKELD